MTFELMPPPASVVCIGAHPDDIEIGAAGTLLRLAAEYPDASFRFVVLAGDEARSAEAGRSAAELIPGRTRFDAGGFRDGFLPYDEAAPTKEWLTELAVTQPDLVLAPWADDRHQDHRFAGELAWQVFRGVPILEYEIPKWEGDRPGANFYVSLSSGVMEQKLDHLARHFESQHGKKWYDPEVFRSVARLRGMEADAGFAEAFVARKVVLA